MMWSISKLFHKKQFPVCELNKMCVYFNTTDNQSENMDILLPLWKY